MFYNIIISNLYKVKNTYIKILIVYISRTELLLEEMRGSNLLYCLKNARREGHRSIQAKAKTSEACQLMAISL